MVYMLVKVVISLKIFFINLDKLPKENSQDLTE